MPKDKTKQKTKYIQLTTMYMFIYVCVIVHKYGT